MFLELVCSTHPKNSRKSRVYIGGRFKDVVYFMIPKNCGRWTPFEEHICFKWVGFNRKIGWVVEKSSQHALLSNENNPGCSFRVLGRARFWSCTPHSKRLFLCILNIVSYGFGNKRPRTQTEHSSHWEQCFCLCQRCDTCPNLWKNALRFWNFWVILETCPNLWWRSCSKCYAIDCFGTYLKHVMTFVFKVLRNRLLRYILETCHDVRVQSATQSTASVHTWNMSNPVMTFMFKVQRNRLLRCILETCLWSCMLCNPVKRCISCT